MAQPDTRPGPPAGVEAGRRSLTPVPLGPYLRPSERHPPEEAPEIRSRTEKRPSSRPLLLSNRPLFAVYMPYLLSYCAGAKSCPGPAVAAPSGPRLCGFCELRYGPWGVALLLLHLLLLLTGGKENLAVCHQHKHPCCCCCCRRLFLPPAAFAAAIVAALPSWWSCCSSCYPPCAHHPTVSF